MNTIKINVVLEIPEKWNLTQADIDEDIRDPQTWLNIVSILTEHCSTDVKNPENCSVNVELTNRDYTVKNNDGSS